MNDPISKDNVLNINGRLAMKPGFDTSGFISTLRARALKRLPALLGEVLGKALMMMRGEYYRDYLYDVIGMMSDMHYPLYERVSFGPGQRYASKGSYIVQLGSGRNPVLERRSEWVIP